MIAPAVTARAAAAAPAPPPEGESGPPSSDPSRPEPPIAAGAGAEAGPHESRNRRKPSSSSISPRRPTIAPAPDTPEPVKFVNFTLADPFPLRTRHRRRLGIGRATSSLFALHRSHCPPG